MVRAKLEGFLHRLRKTITYVWEFVVRFHLLSKIKNVYNFIHSLAYCTVLLMTKWCCLHTERCVC